MKLFSTILVGATAMTNTWTGGPGNWMQSDCSNWSLGTCPAAGMTTVVTDDVVFSETHDPSNAEDPRLFSEGSKIIIEDTAKITISAGSLMIVGGSSTFSPTASPTAYPTPAPTPAPTAAPTDMPHACSHTTCEVRNGHTIVMGGAPGVENWSCNNKGGVCSCLCHYSFKCTLEHHTAHNVKHMHHCSALRSSPAPTSAPTTPTPQPTQAPTTPTSDYQKGTVNIPNHSGTACKIFNFPRAFSSTPRIIVSVNHRNSPSVHHSQSGWTEWVTTTQFKACTRELNADDIHDQMNFDYVAWTGDKMGNAEATGWTTSDLDAGTNCWVRKFNDFYTSAPIVVLSIDHSNINRGDVNQKHDAIFAWVEGITATEFRVCASESSLNSVGTHNPVTINYMAFNQGSNYALTDAHGRSGALNGGATIYDTVCKTVPYGKTYSSAPIVIATVNHATSSMSTIHDSFIAWAENVGTSSFKLCGRESDFNDGPHDGATFVDWVVVA